jgi:hypothetical protein
VSNRTEYMQINNNGAYALTRFGVNGQNTSYNFYVNGTSYFKGNATHEGHILASADSTYNIGSTGVHWANGYFDQLFISTDTGFVSSTAGKPGTQIQSGAIELAGTTPYIDFHCASTALDYSSRIIADSQCRIRFNYGSGTPSTATYAGRNITP